MLFKATADISGCVYNEVDTGVLQGSRLGPLLFLFNIILLTSLKTDVLLKYCVVL